MTKRHLLPLLVLPALALACTACSGVGSGAADDSSPSLRAGHRPPGGAKVLPHDVQPPEVARLDPDLRAAVDTAIRDAARDGVTMTITSGWRSRAHQQRLYDEAVQRYGSEEEARRYVATPDTSAHVTGDAVDIGPTEADDWLSRHGADYGLCRTFANEIWHFELSTSPGGTCPALLPDGSSR